MCGIIAYSGRSAAAEKLYRGLKRLEYRGYDSAGISTLSEGCIFTAKHGGRVERLRADLGALSGCTGIGHTRWATHGRATDANAHPHLCGRFSIVHNGIIRNCEQLKKELKGLGRTFFSQTDSEVIAHLLDMYYCGDMLQAMSHAVARLKGLWAVAALCADFNGFIVARRSSPVVLGEGDDGFYAASDVHAIVGCAHSCCVLEDGDIAVVTPEGMRVYDSLLNPVARAFEPVPAECAGGDMEGCPHYMLKEIRQNAAAITDTCDGFFRCEGADGLFKKLARADKIVLTGCGTAYIAALTGARLVGSAYACPVSAHIAGEYCSDPPRLTARSVCIAVTQSGETADTLAASSIARGCGAYLIAVTNCPRSAVTRLADFVVPVCAGPEVCVAATKSYIGQLACFHLLAAGECAMRRAGQLQSVAAKVKKLAFDGAYARVIASLCASSRAVFFLGRGGDVDVAVEGSLKLKEVSYIFSAGYPAGELKHGTLALVDESVLSIVLMCDQCLVSKCESAVEQILSRGGKVAVITTLPSAYASVSPRVQAAWLLPQTCAHLSHFISSTALQLVAYHTALLVGRDPDKPRNLAKSVTVE